ncbi:MmgE/PrpD family protein [Microbacterium sp. BWT-B31]|uniref:MmgE/PrpD family protein n=1 Tax=Microbacterium sp. BWT-B31 TaxID=3232072 RepID=UPI003527802B
MTITQIETSFTDRLVDDVQAIAHDGLSEADLTRAKAALIDYLGVALAGTSEESTRIARAFAEAEGGNPRSTLIGTTTKTSMSQASLVNSIAAHALDFDDTSIFVGGHATSVIMPAALAVGEALGSSGRDILAAFSAGVHAMSVVGLATGEQSYARGFHNTGTVGVFGAAVAAGVLAQLDDDGLRRALSLAATQASGLKVVFGTMGKHLNAGRAAANGVFAALAAKDGFTAPDDGIEAARGYQWTHSDRLDIERVDRELAGRSGIWGVVAKRHACCHGTHSAVESIRAAKALRDFADDEIVSVVLTARPIVRGTCDIPEPVTGLEGKFSLRYVSALALADEPTTSEGFTDEKTQDPRLVALRDKVEVQVAEGLSFGETRVSVSLVDGTRIDTNVNAIAPVEDADLDAHLEAISLKFADLADLLIGADRVARVLGIARGFENAQSCDELNRLLAVE